jgi:predicted GNAT family acetyltransferase
LRSVRAVDASNSFVQKGATNKGYAAVGKDPAFSESSPVISEPVLISAHNNETVPEVTKAENSNSQCEVEVSDVSHDLEKQGTAGSTASNEAERLREEQAAVKAQAAFRGYLVMFLFSFWSCID